MRPPLSQSPIRLRVSTLPRPKTQAAAYLDIYKRVSEKQRLQQELEQVEQRRDRILNRLEVLNSEVLRLEQTVQDLRLEPGVPAPAIAVKKLLQRIHSILSS